MLASRRRAAVALALQVGVVVEGVRTKGRSPDQRDLVEGSIGACVEPEHPEALAGAWDELIWSKMDREGPLGVDGWSNYPFGNPHMPLHMMVGLLRNDSKYTQEPPEDFAAAHNLGMDAECFNFDYDRADGPDPSGCRVFAKSFKPLQQLRTCIVGHLEQDDIWSQRENQTMEDGDFKGPYPEWCRQSVWTYLKFGFANFPAKLCSRFDSNRRAQEMIKMVLFKPVPDDVDAATQLVERKVCRTVTWPQHKQAPPCLQSTTVTAIRSQCFKIEEGRPLKESKFLGRVGPCLPLMFDKVEIQGFGLNDGITKFQDEGYYGNAKQNLAQSYKPKAPAMCGRLALAAIPMFQRARYSLTSWQHMISDAMAWDTEPSWSECLHVRETNCRKMYFCWEKALRRMCAFSPNCCPGEDAQAREEVHAVCERDPNRGLCPTQLGTWSGNRRFHML